jgi:hypothetical protein
MSSYPIGSNSQGVSGTQPAYSSYLPSQPTKFPPVTDTQDTFTRTGKSTKTPIIDTMAPLAGPYIPPMSYGYNPYMMGGMYPYDMSMMGMMPEMYPY